MPRRPNETVLSLVHSETVRVRWSMRVGSMAKCYRL